MEAANDVVDFVACVTDLHILVHVKRLYFRLGFVVDGLFTEPWRMVAIQHFSVLIEVLSADQDVLVRNFVAWLQLPL